MKSLLTEIRACRHCEEFLPLGCRPLLQASTTARVLIVGQAPGARAHAAGIPWHDPSGDRLRDWLAIDSATFYDNTRIAILPMGFCYPGKGKNGDLPPRPECAPLWQDRVLERMPDIQVSLLIGQYAQKHLLGARCKRNLTATVRAWAEYLPRYLPLPHPSPRNQRWFKNNPWFDSEVIPALREVLYRFL